MEENRVQWKIGGPAGKGVKSSGLIFAKTCTRAGLHIFGYTEYPSVIKGGHNVYQVRVEPDEVTTLIKSINILVALDRYTITAHHAEVAKDGVILYDADRVSLAPENKPSQDVSLVHVPALKISHALGVDEVMENQVFLGATFALLELDFDLLAGVIKDEFKSKGEEIIAKDIAAAKAGYDHVLGQGKHTNFPHVLKPLSTITPKMVLTGNDAVAFGAMAAGCKFYAAYPMTPASSILHTMAQHQHRYNMVVKHAEDEISVVNMTIGAGFAGVRAMCGTSGGGFCLMSEGYSLAGMTETPLVMVEAMRGGPATGIPTWTEQADLQMVLHAGHGEFPRFVFAPGDPEEAYYLTAEAFNVADRFQTPVVILIDKHLSESHWSYPFFDKSIKIDRGKWVTDEELKRLASQQIRFARYADSPDGVSVRVVPGQHKNGIFLANSDEHDPYGYSSEEIDNRLMMSGKRARKEETYLNEMPNPPVYGHEEPDLTLVCWGSTKTMALQALNWLLAEGRKVNLLHLNRISPFPSAAVKETLSRSPKLLNIEHNATAQMAEVIRGKTGVEMDYHLLKNDGRPILPEEIADRARTILEGDV